MTASVISAGFQTTVQDCGRAGLRKFGVTPGGALDSVSLRLANLLVGNPECVAGLEVTSGRVRLKLIVSIFLRVNRGKNSDDDNEAKLLAQKFGVEMNSDRMGLRLVGGEMVSTNPAELVSEAVAPGTIQLPRSGAPVVLLGDCQTIGGYPKIAHVITVDLGYAAQLQPLDEVRFELIKLEEARDLLRERERDVALFRAGLEARFG